MASINFKLWLENKLWIPGNPLTDTSGNPIVMYHGTDKVFSRFSSKKSAMGGIIWMTNDRTKIERKEVGASGHGRIISMYVTLMNPAGWEEYDKLLLYQLKSQGYDGAILDDPNGTFDAFVFSPKQIKIIKKENLT